LLSVSIRHCLRLLMFWKCLGNVCDNQVPKEHQSQSNPTREFRRLPCAVFIRLTVVKLTCYVSFPMIDGVSRRRPVGRQEMKHYIAMDFLLPIIILSICSATLAYSNLDIGIQRLLYSESGGWFYRNTNPWLFFYRYGIIPAITLGAAAFSLFLSSLWLQNLKKYRKQALYIVMALLLGPGLIVNTMLKDHWGRPRPSEISQFDGSKTFHKVWQKGNSGSGYSFPCGHASMGFFLLSPYFLFRGRSKRWAIGFLTVGLVYGLLMGLGRMMQGQHFISDVIWSGGFVYLSSAACDYLLGLHRADI